MRTVTYREKAPLHPLVYLTTSSLVVTTDNVKAERLVARRIALSETEFVELILWRVPAPIAPSTRRYTYRYAFVSAGECVVRYDNERGKGDHRHYGGPEGRYRFVSPEKLEADFLRDVERWQRESRGS